MNTPELDLYKANEILKKVFITCGFEPVSIIPFECKNISSRPLIRQKNKKRIKKGRIESL